MKYIKLKVTTNSIVNNILITIYCCVELSASKLYIACTYKKITSIQICIGFDNLLYLSIKYFKIDIMY